MTNMLDRAYRALVEALDLSGSDGRLSFQKLVILLVLAAGVWSGISTTLAIAIIAASFGRTVFVNFLNRGTFNAMAEHRTQRTITKTITQTLDDRRKDDERG